MSLTESAKQKINSIFSSNPIAISYTLIGISTAILGYYTFFDNNISETVPEPTTTPTSIPSSIPPSISPIAPQSTPQFGGKHKKTHKNKHVKK
jgi:hypothetical protein